MSPVRRSIEEIRDAAGRLHATAWRGAKGWDSPEKARFCIPRQGGDDDEIVYTAIDELEALRQVADAAEKLVDEIHADNRTDEEQEEFCRVVEAVWRRWKVRGSTQATPSSTDEGTKR